MILPEMLEVVKNFKAKIEDRMENCFFGMATGFKMRKLGPEKSDELKDHFLVFIFIVILFIDTFLGILSKGTELRK